MSREERRVRIPRFPEPAATDTVVVDVAPDSAYEVVSDPTVMIRFAEEAHRVRWLDGARPSEVGARFKGYNRNGVHRWVTDCRVTDAEPGRCFAYEVTASPLRIPVSRWQYDIEPAGDGGCRVTETNWLRAPLWFIPFAVLITGVSDRMGANNAHIATTLHRLKAHLEQAPGA